MATVEQLATLKQQVADYTARRERAAGAYESAMAVLKEQGFDTIEEARERLEQLERERDRLEKKFDSAYADFIAKWGDKLSGKDG